MNVAGTLGQVLYSNPSRFVESERAWLKLLERSGVGDRAALLSLFDRTGAAAFTLAMRLTCDRETAEQLLLEIYGELPRHAGEYSAADSSVLAWVMRRARSMATARLRAERDDRHVLKLREQRAALAAALDGLTPEERQAIEAVYFNGLHYGQASAVLQRAASAIKADLRNGMQKLVERLEHTSRSMAWPSRATRCEQAELVYAHALYGLPADEAASLAAHCAACSSCGLELEAGRRILDFFVAWPTDLLRPPPALKERLAARIGGDASAAATSHGRYVPPPWHTVAPGISCKVLTQDTERHTVSMLVRVVPGGEYPPHTHAGVEELHLLEGELWIDERKLHPGDYNRAEPGTADKHVWSETGCACVLVTSARDVLT